VWIAEHREKASHAFNNGTVDDFADAAICFLQACSKLPTDDPLFLPSFYIDGMSPVSKPLVGGWNMLLSKASFASGKDRHGNNRSGYAFVGDRGVGKSLLLQLCAVVPSILLDNVVGVYFDAKSDDAITNRLTPLALLREALLRRLSNSATVLPKPHIIEAALKNGGSMDGLLNAARTNKLAVVVCVDEAQGTYAPESPTADSWPQIHGILQSFTGCAFISDSTTVLPTLVRGSDKNMIELELKYSETRHSLNGDKMAIIPVDGMKLRDQYIEFLQKRCLDSSEVAKMLQNNPNELENMHLHTSGRFRSIEKYLSKTGPVQYDEDLNMPTVGTLGYTLLGRMLAVVRMENSPVMKDPFQYRLFTESCILQWVQSFNRHKGKSYGYAEVARLVENHIISQHMLRSVRSDVEGNIHGQYTLRSDSQDPLYTFGSPRQLRRLLDAIPSVFVSFAWSDREHTNALKMKLRAMAGVTVIVCSTPAAKAFINDKSIAAFEFMEAMGVKEGDNAFMLLVLTQNYIKQLAKHQMGVSTGVGREVEYAVRLVKDGHGSKLRFASPESNAFDELVPKLPIELQELAQAGLIFDTVDGGRALAQSMTEPNNKKRKPIYKNT
jgi:hypothetical protein